MKLVSSIVVLLCITAGCGDSDDGGGGGANTYTLTLQLSDIDAAHDGRGAFSKLIEEGGDCAGPQAPLQVSNCVVSGGGCDLTFTAVSAGSYHACFFIDTDGSAGDVPNSGDLIGDHAVTVDEDLTEPVSTATWVALP